MTSKPPIPPVIWQRIQDFLKEGRTGEIVLNVHQGVVSDASIKERIREVERTERAAS